MVLSALGSVLSTVTTLVAWMKQVADRVDALTLKSSLQGREGSNVQNLL